MMNANDNEWDEIMRSLETAGICRIESVGNQIVYVMPDKMVNEWKKHFEQDGKERTRTKTFEIRGDVKPTSVLDWEIYNNTYYIKVDAFGVF